MWGSDNSLRDTVLFCLPEADDIIGCLGTLVVGDVGDWRGGTQKIMVVTSPTDDYLIIF